MNNAAIIAQTMNNAGFDVLPMEMDLSSRSSILSLIDEAQKHMCGQGYGCAPFDGVPG